MARFYRFIDRIVWFTGPVAFGILSLFLGRSIDWDLRNYHYYNPYAYLAGRINYDFAPAQHQSFLNPLLDIPFYLIINTSPAWVVGFLYGAIAGLNFTFLFFLTQHIATGLRPVQRIFISLIISLVGCLGPAFLLEVGLNLQDNIVSLFVIGGLIYLISVSRLINSGCKSRGISNSVFAAALFGIGAGFKPTVAVFFLASAVALILTLDQRHDRIRIFLLYCTTGIVAVLVVSGFWMWTLWEHFENPLFPFFNNIFNSPVLKPIATQDARFLPQTLWQIIFWPILFSFDLNRVWEFGGKDFRFTIIYIMLLLLLLQYFYLIIKQRTFRVISLISKSSLFDYNETNLLLIFFIISYVLWMMVFSIYRYLMPLEIISPLLFVIIVDRLCLPKRWTISIIALGLLLMVAFIKSPVYFVRAEWTPHYIQVEAPSLDNPDQMLVLMLGTDAMSYVVPSFPPKVRFLREEGNLQSMLSTRFIDNLISIVRSHKNNLYVLFPENDKTVDIEKISNRFSITILLDHCQSLHTNMKDHLLLCIAIPETQ